MKTSELSGIALDWAVGKCEGHGINGPYAGTDWVFCFAEPDGSDGDAIPEYSTDWDQGGPIIEREGINIFKYSKLDEREPDKWCGHKAVLRRAMDGLEYTAALTLDGPTPLIAAMRCYVASKLGDEVEIPKEPL